MGTLYKRTDRGGKAGNWYAEFTNHNGKRIKRSTRTPNKQTAQKILSHWENESAKRSSGLIDPALERLANQSQRPIEKHVREFIAALDAGGRSQVHVDRTQQRIDAVVESTGWQTAGDITPESLEAYAAGLRRAGRSPQTIAHHIQAVKQLSRWIHRTGRIIHNPLAGVNKPNPQTDRRLQRRMLLPREWPHLRAAAADRAIVYETAIQTGFRSSEFRALKWANLHSDGRHPYIEAPSRTTKDSRPARQFITPRLAKLIATRSRTRGKLFDLPDEYAMADMLRADLASARAAWLEADGDADSDFLLPINDAGGSLDFHALRHTCGAWLAMKDVHPKRIQTIMRHKTITLTMDTYGHLFPNSEPDDIARLDDFLK